MEITLHIFRPEVKYGVKSPKFIWAPVYVQLYSYAETPHLPPPTAFGLIHEGAIGQPRKTKSLCYSLFLTEDLRMDVL